MSLEAFEARKKRNDEIKTLFSEGYSAKGLSKLFSLSPSFIRKIIKTDVNPSYIVFLSKFASRDKEIIEKHKAGRARKLLAGDYNLSPQMIGKILRKAGIYKYKVKPK